MWLLEGMDKAHRTASMHMFEDFMGKRLAPKTANADRSNQKTDTHAVDGTLHSKQLWVRHMRRVRRGKGAHVKVQPQTIRHDEPADSDADGRVDGVASAMAKGRAGC